MEDGASRDDKSDATWIASIFTEDATRRPFNVLVYRIASFGGRKSVSVFSSKSAQYIERNSFSLRHWTLLLVEMFISFSWSVIRARRRTLSDLLRRDITERQELIDIYGRRGVAAVFSILCGYAADTYFSIYHFALFNVALHHLLCCFLFLEETIKNDDFDMYPDVVSETVGFSIIPLKATDFARLVYGLELLGRKNVKVVVLFIFLSLWMNEKSAGGILLLTISLFQTSWVMRVRLSYLFSGLGVIVFIYFLRPTSEDRIKSMHGVGKAVVGVIFTALWTKYKYRGLLNRGSWLNFAELKYDRVSIVRTKQVLLLYLLLLPTVGVSFFVAIRSDFNSLLWSRLVPTGLFAYTGIEQGYRLMAILSMGGVQFIVLPILTRLTGVKRKLLQHFMFGYLTAASCFIFAAFTLYLTESEIPDNNTGIMRIYNARFSKVSITSQDYSITRLNYSIPPKTAINVAIGITESTLFKLKVIFSEEAQYTIHFTVIPNRQTGYVFLDPPNIVKTGRFMPISEGTTGNNDPAKSTVAFSNTLIHTTILVLELIENDLPTKKHFIECIPGKLAMKQVSPGRYEAYIKDVDLGEKSVIASLRVGERVNYIAHANSTDTMLELDRFITPKGLTGPWIIHVAISYGVGLTLSYVTIRAILIYNTPEGLEGLGFGFLEFLENAASFVVYIGYLTWHEYPSPFDVLIYGLTVALIFFFNLFVILRHGELYRW